MGVAVPGLSTAKLACAGLVILTLVGCGTRRFYPLMQFRPTERPPSRLDLGSVALLESGLVVTINEQSSAAIYEVSPFQDATGAWRSIDPLGETFEELFVYSDPSQTCPGDIGSKKWNACRSRKYRSHVPIIPRPIAWAPNADGKIVPPALIEDLSAFPCPEGDDGCEGRVLGVTEYSTIGRITEFREDTVPKSREELERVFVLERRDGEWSEVRLPEIEDLRQRLSDWGRANCELDLVVEGIAFDPDTDTVFFGVNRCMGTAQTVLAYALGDARDGAAITLDVIADGIRNGAGHDLAGPSEGISGLDFAYGHVWATSSWDDYGYGHEPTWGGRLLVVDEGRLLPVPMARTLSDRSDALTILPSHVMPTSARESTDPRELFPWITALVTFDNDIRSRSARPNATVVAASTPAPPGGASAQLHEFGLSPLGEVPVGLNGFDFRWYLRDHRLGYLAAIVGDQPSGPGAWTSQLGGLWQVRLGMLGRSTRWMAGKPYGHNRQAVAVTSYEAVPELSFTGWRAVVSVVPGERTGDEVSIAQVLADRHDEYVVEATLPEAASEGAGLILQGFAVDTSPRAAGGVCVTAMDLGVEWADPAVRDRVKLRAVLLGGLCNDFNSREPEEFHGLTTDPSAGVRVVLYFAVVEGGDAQAGTIVAAQRDRPGDRTEPTGVVFDPAARPRATYVSRDAPETIENHPSKDNLACLLVEPTAATVLPWPRHREGPPPDEVEWWIDPRGALPTGASEGRGGSLSGFAMALDLRGFDPSLQPDAYADVTELTARSQNVYVYRYLMRTFLADNGVFLEGGISHGLHLGGLGKDNALPTALLVRSDLTWWDGLSATPVAWDAAGDERDALDPNLQPEDGYLRWAWTRPLEGEPTCSPR